MKVTEPNPKCRNWQAYLKPLLLPYCKGKRGFQVYPFTVVTLPIVYILANQYAYRK